MAAQTQTNSWRERGDAVVVWYRCASLGVGMVVVAGSTVKRGGDMSPVVQGSAEVISR